MLKNMRVLEPKSTEVMKPQKSQESRDLSCVRCTTARMGDTVSGITISDVIF